MVTNMYIMNIFCSVPKGTHKNSPICNSNWSINKYLCYFCCIFVCWEYYS